MKESDLAVWLGSPDGAKATRDAANMLRTADPEIDDLELVNRVQAMGFPDWSARLLFFRALGRVSPFVCKSCGDRVKPRKDAPVDRTICTKCSAKTLSPEQAQKIFARKTAMEAEWSGKLKPQPCASCGWRKAHKHHPDYSRPLYVIWLCTRCHAAEHKRLRTGKTKKEREAALDLRINF